jgi:hypothetical protein
MDLEALFLERLDGMEKLTTLTKGMAGAET